MLPCIMIMFVVSTAVPPQVVWTAGPNTYYAMGLHFTCNSTVGGVAPISSGVEAGLAYICGEMWISMYSSDVKFVTGQPKAVIMQPPKFNYRQESMIYGFIGRLALNCDNNLIYASSARNADSPGTMVALHNMFWYMEDPYATMKYSAITQQVRVIREIWYNVLALAIGNTVVISHREDGSYSHWHIVEPYDDIATDGLFYYLLVGSTVVQKSW